MNMMMRELRLAHCDGHTSICYDSSGEYILTGGADNKVCIWDGPDDTDTTTVHIGDNILSLAFQGGRFFTGTAENVVRIHTFPDGVGDGLVTRFSAPVRHINISDDGSMIVAGADDFQVKVIITEDNECTCIYKEHEAPILSVALDPTGEFVASASCDGTVRIWTIDGGSTEQTLEILSKYNDANQAESLCRISWSADGEFLFVPVKNEIQIYSRSSWEMIGKMFTPSIEDTISVTSLCPGMNNVIAVGGIKGSIGIFDFQSKKLIQKISHPKNLAITSLAWNPKKEKELSFCDNMGQLGCIEVNCVSEKEKEVDAFDDMDDDILAASGPNDNLDLDPEGENSIDIGSIKRSLQPLMENDEDADSVTSKQATPIPAQAPVLPANIFKPTPLQPPFQSGSTPEHVSSRFMVWNNVGIVRQYTSEEENSIDVEFHDTATHHALHVDNTSEYVMAALSSTTLVLASRGDEDTPSKLMCMQFGSWDSFKEWSYTMPTGEEIQAVTATDKWLAIATASCTLRVFSAGGLQLQLFSLPGRIVALSSHGQSLMFAYHKGMGVPGEQFLGVTALKLETEKKSVIVKDETLPLSPGSRLAWLGFTDEGSPLYMDNAGVMRILNPCGRSMWWPIANTKQHAKGKSDHYWLVSVSEQQQQIRCIPCKGSRYPATLPRPALAVLPLQLPLLEMESEKSRYEESYLRECLLNRNSNLQIGVESDRTIREALMKLFALSAKAEREFRALEVCDMMEDQGILHIAATYASRLKRVNLAERVGRMMHKRQNSETPVEAESDYEDDRLNCRLEVNGDNSGDEEAEETHEHEVDTEDKLHTTGPLLKTIFQKEGKKKEKSTGKPNPFKVASSAERNLRGTRVFDKMEKSTPKSSLVFAPLPVSIKKSGKKLQTNSGQAKLSGFKKSDTRKSIESTNDSKQEILLSQYSTTEETTENDPVKKKVSAFDLWLAEKRDELQEEFPDLSEEDLTQKATLVFRSLDKDERQLWVQKAKSKSGSLESTNKRKITEDESYKKEDPALKKLKSEENVSEKKSQFTQSINAKLAKFAKVD